MRTPLGWLCLLAMSCCEVSPYDPMEPCLQANPTFADAQGEPVALDRHLGCIDLKVVATDAEGGVALVIEMDGELAAAAHEAGEAKTWERSVSEVVRIRLEVGEGAAEPYCNDVAMDPPALQRVYEASSGLIALQLEPEGEPTDWGEVPARASLVLRHLVLESEDHDPIEVGCFQVDDVAVGWMPG